VYHAFVGEAVAAEDDIEEGVGQPARVLVVDDDLVVIKALCRLLTRDGIEAVPVGTADEAIRAAREEEFDAILSDIRMPGMDGLELMRSVRSFDLDIPIILLTGEPSIDTAQRAVELGAFRYLTKPPKRTELVEAIKRAAFAHRMATLKRRALALAGGGLDPGDRMGLSVAFERSLERLELNYQPIVHARDGSLFGFEALMRSRERSLPNPGAVVDAAERLRRVHDLSRVVRERAVSALEQTRDNVTLFVNLHPLDLHDPELLSGEAPMTRLAPRVVLEFTERTALEPGPEVADIVNRLRDLGYAIAVDDLGAGYAGLTSFAALEPDIVKIDMNLTRGIHDSPIKRRLVRSVVELCADLGVLVVAEGIETREEREACIRLGCDLLQGYAIARPGPAFPAINW
jgi:EAL domain-containing protein (putative c-di-GMP-specific phosphodiesterase class I)